MAEFRWILLGLGTALLVGIWWWGTRRSGQAPGKSELRETTAIKEPHLSELKPEVEPMLVDRDWGTPPLEPLSIHTADFDAIPVMDEPIMVDIESIEIREPLPPREPFVPHITQPVPVGPPTLTKIAEPIPDTPRAFPDTSDRIATLPPPMPNTSERQKIVSVRVCANGKPWPGSQLLAALELHGLAYGKYQVFHRRHADGRSLFCVASLKEPGTFDVAQMTNQEFKGVTLFAVLPGPLEPLLTVDELLSSARELAQELTGALQDAKGMPLSPQRAAALRDDVARFQASMPLS